MPRDNLENGTNDIADEAERDRLLAPELVTQGEGEDSAAEGTELDTPLIRLGFHASSPRFLKCHAPRNSWM